MTSPDEVIDVSGMGLVFLTVTDGQLAQHEVSALIWTDDFPELISTLDVVTTSGANWDTPNCIRGLLYPQGHIEGLCDLRWERLEDFLRETVKRRGHLRRVA